MTYLQFLLFFLIPPVIVLGILQGRHRSEWRPYARIGIIGAIALIYTTPWDNYLIAIEAWSYAPAAVVGTLGLVPVEEYAFFLLQPLATGLLYEVLPRGTAIAAVKRGPEPVGASVAVILACFGAAAILTEISEYLGLILVWSCPVIALQWVYNGALLGRAVRSWMLPLAISTAYLWVADGIAIRNGIWSISDKAIVGWKVAGLPLEEMVFFLMTNAMVLFGLILLEGSSIHLFSERSTKGDA